MKDISNALETTGLFLAGLSTMLLIVVSALAIGSTIVDSHRTASGFIESAPQLSLSFDELASVSQQFNASTGQVAGVVDDSSVNEQNLRNQAADWLSQARADSGLDVVYRDELLDRRAQNHARLLAEACDTGRYNDWQEAIGQPLSEDYITSFGEAIFSLTDSDFTRQLPKRTNDYPRLFTIYKAYGVGVAQTSETCSSDYILTFHLADVQ